MTAVAIRAPSVFSLLDDAASYGAARTELDGSLAGADALGVDTLFVQAAATRLPATAQYAIVLPPSDAAAADHEVGPLTVQGLPAFMLEVLLPRLQVQQPHVGDYLLCYACDTGRWQGRVRWLWSDGRGNAIGAVRR